MSKHTPGPWVSTATDVEHIATVAWCGAYCVGRDYRSAPHNTNYETHGSDEADARLIAAAPDLLSALQGMCSVWQTICNSKGWDADHMQQFKDARAAIAKATGEA